MKVPQRHQPASSQHPPAVESGPSRSDAVFTGALYAVLFLLGFGVGVYGSFYYSLFVWVVPVGAIAAVLATFAMCWGIRHWLRARPPAVLAGGGWLVAVLMLSSRRPEGDVLIAGGGAGYVLILGGAAAAAIAVVVRPGR